MHLTRRQSLAAAGAALATATLGAAARPAPWFGPGGRPLGIQLYMVSAEFGRDPAGTLRQLAAIGYREIEGSFDQVTPERVAPVVRGSGLACTTVGLLPFAGRGNVTLNDDAGRIAAGVHRVGARSVTCTLFPLPEGLEMRPQPGESVPAMLARVTAALPDDHWLRVAEFLNARGAALRREGLRLAYHNHNPELRPRRETNGLAILLEHTDPALVDFEMDAGWVVAGGGDPVAFLRAYPGRFRMMHVKDMATDMARNYVLSAVTPEVGGGMIDWRRVIGAARTAGVRHFAVEQEPPFRRPPLESARISFDYLSRLSA